MKIIYIFLNIGVNHAVKNVNELLGPALINEVCNNYLSVYINNILSFFNFIEFQCHRTTKNWRVYD